MEKIIQIAVTSGGEENLTDVLYALTDAGRVFCLSGADSNTRVPKHWRELPEIPGLFKAPGQ